MSSDGSTLLFRALPANHKFTASEKLRLSRFIELLAERIGAGRAFTCLITTDKELQNLNHRFRGHDYATDVLSFPALSPNADLGEMAISAERATAQARQYGHDRVDEVRILMLHGLLHLTGMDHERDQGQMKAAEQQWRAEFDLPGALLSRATVRTSSRAAASVGKSGVRSTP